MPGGTGGPTERAMAAWAALDEEASMRVQAILAAQLSLWDAPLPVVASAVLAVTPRKQPLRTAPLPVSGKWQRPERDTRLVVTGEGETDGGTEGEQFAWAGEMVCGNERHYALLVRYDERDDAMAPRRCVSIGRVRMVVMMDGEQ
jgi:hypothetical protein